MTTSADGEENHLHVVPVAAIPLLLPSRDTMVLRELPRMRHFGKKRVKANIALPGEPTSELRDVTRHMGWHSVTCQPTQVKAPRLTLAMQAGFRFTYPGGMEG